MPGYIKLYRDLQQNWLWEPERPRTKLEAWIDLIMMANHKENTFVLGNELTTVPRGSLITSELKLMERWKWSKTKVRAFLKLLENENMIVQKKDRKKTALSLTNYEVYQDWQTEKEPQKNREETAKEPQKDTNNNDNNVNNEKNDNNILFPEEYTDQERQILNHLKSIPKYPFDFDKDIKHIRQLMIDFPDVNILEEVKQYATWLLDKPLKANSKPRSQLRRFCTNASKWSKEGGSNNASYPQRNSGNAINLQYKEEDREDPDKQHGW